MHRIHIILTLALAFALALCLPQATAEKGAVTVTDMMGREITLAEPAQRIVALTAADCEILCALGCEDALVGRGEYCDYPASVLDIPSVQSGYETNIEQIIALQPQVVLMATMAQTVEQVEQLENAGIQIVISDAQNIEGVYTSIRNIGTLMGKDDEAEAIISDMQTTFDNIASQAKHQGKTVYFEVTELQYGLWAAGRGTFMDEVATMCGLTNIFADVDGWGSVSEDQVIQRNPDCIVTITMYYGQPLTPVEEIKSRKGWQVINAVANDCILNADSNELSRPGPRLKDAALTLFQFVQRMDEAVEPAA